jgi:Mrp family chromosome partitioning ATPase
MNIPLSVFELPFLFLVTVSVKYMKSAPDTNSSPRLPKPRTYKADPYLELVQNVIFPAALPQRRCIQLTSAHQGAGVTRTCRAMADTLMNTMGKTVLVVPADELFRLATSKTENLLTGASDSEPKDLSVMARGVPFKLSENICIRPPSAEADPAALIQYTLEKMLERFNLVIVDSPSLDASSLPIIVARAVAGTILVVEAGRSRRKHLVQAAARMDAAQSPLLGFVLNKRTYPIPSWIHRWLQ